MSRIVLARHGETLFNTRDVFRGRADPALTEAGLPSVRRQAEGIARLHPRRILASPRRRALQTAEIIADRCQRFVEVEERLDDLDYGEWTGLSKTDAATRSPEQWIHYERSPEALVPPHGEPMSAFVERLNALWSERSEDEDVVVLVTHDVVIRALVCSVLHAPRSSMHALHVDVASTTCVELRPKPTLVWLNDNGRS